MKTQVAPGGLVRQQQVVAVGPDVEVVDVGLVQRTDHVDIRGNLAEVFVQHHDFGAVRAGAASELAVGIAGARMGFIRKDPEVGEHLVIDVPAEAGHAVVVHDDQIASPLVARFHVMGEQESGLPWHRRASWSSVWEGIAIEAVDGVVVRAPSVPLSVMRMSARGMPAIPRSMCHIRAAGTVGSTPAVSRRPQPGGGAVRGRQRQQHPLRAARGVVQRLRVERRVEGSIVMLERECRVADGQRAQGVRQHDMGRHGLRPSCRRRGRRCRSRSPAGSGPHPPPWACSWPTRPR